MEVVAAILTYNRIDLVQRCISSILDQKAIKTKIIVVDNGSSDGTENIISKYDSEKVYFHRIDRNIGAAGGFNTALKLGYESGADFVWMMDDDVICDPNALEKLLEAFSLLREQGQQVPYLVSKAHAPSGAVTNVPDVDHRLNALAYQHWSQFLEHGLVPVSRATFVSALFPRKTIQRFGLPLSRMFIWGEDSEYTLRVTREAPGFLVGSSHVEHVRAAAGAPDIVTEQNAVRVAWHRHRIRNDIYIDRKYRRKRAVLRRIVNNLKLVMQLMARREFHKARIVLTGIVQGIFFNPEPEQVGACGTQRNSVPTPPETAPERERILLKG